jgi:hypothetical protein
MGFHLESWAHFPSVSDQPDEPLEIPDSSRGSLACHFANRLVVRCALSRKMKFRSGSMLFSGLTLGDERW